MCLLAYARFIRSDVQCEMRLTANSDLVHIILPPCLVCVIDIICLASWISLILVRISIWMTSLCHNLYNQISKCTPVTKL